MFDVPHSCKSLLSETLGRELIKCNEIPWRKSSSGTEVGRRAGVVRGTPRHRLLDLVDTALLRGAGEAEVTVGDGSAGSRTDLASATADDGGEARAGDVPGERSSRALLEPERDLSSLWLASVTECRMSSAQWWRPSEACWSMFETLWPEK